MNPTRCCIACRKRKEKKNLIRIVADESGNAIYDKEQKINSRALYICKDIQCLEDIKKFIAKNKFKAKIYIESDSFVKLIDELKIEVGE